MMRRTFRKIFIGCKEASLLSSKEREVGLSSLEWLKHRIHMLYCRACRRFRTQLNLIHESITRIVREGLPLSESKKEAMKERIENEL